ACAPSISAPSGQNAALDIPSGEVRLNRSFDVPASGTTTMVLDFNGDQSIRQMGNGRFSMTPVITVVSVQELSAGDVRRTELLGNEGRRPGPVGSGARQISGHLPEAAEVDVPPLNRALRIVRNTGHGVRHVPFGANSSSRPSPSVVITIGCGQI